MKAKPVPFAVTPDGDAASRAAWAPPRGHEWVYLRTRRTTKWNLVKVLTCMHCRCVKHVDFSHTAKYQLPGQPMSAQAPPCDGAT